jgi:hypothetical protein
MIMQNEYQKQSKILNIKNKLDQKIFRFFFRFHPNIYKEDFETPTNYFHNSENKPILKKKISKNSTKNLFKNKLVNRQKI